MVKSSGAQRESDGVVVPLMGVHDNTPGGKDPDFGHVGSGGTRLGMAGEPRSSFAGGHKPVDKVPRLQRRVWVAAQRAPERRFHALLGRIVPRDVLEDAWERVRANWGSAGQAAES